jgi:hypothetical protein
MGLNNVRECFCVQGCLQDVQMAAGIHLHRPSTRPASAYCPASMAVPRQMQPDCGRAESGTVAEHGANFSNGNPHKFDLRTKDDHAKNNLTKLLFVGLPNKSRFE